MNYLKNLAIGLDQMVNVFFLGWPDETFSSRAYRCYPRLAKVIDTLLFFDKNHCKTSFESERLRLQSPPEER